MLITTKCVIRYTHQWHWNRILILPLLTTTWSEMIWSQEHIIKVWCIKLIIVNYRLCQRVGQTSNFFLKWTYLVLVFQLIFSCYYVITTYLWFKTFAHNNWYQILVQIFHCKHLIKHKRHKYINLLMWLCIFMNLQQIHHMSRSFPTWVGS